MMKSKLLHFLLLLSYFSVGAQTTVRWSDSIVVTSTPDAITAPRVNLLPDGTPLVSWGRSGSTSQIWCARLENGAFSLPVGVAQGASEPSLFGFGGYDIAVSGNQVFIVFEQTQQGIFLARSEDGGQTFTKANTVQGPVAGGYSTLSSVVVDGTGNPVVSYIYEQNGTAAYRVSRSQDGGFSFQAPVTGNAPAPGAAVCECCTSDLLASGDSIWLLFRNNNLNVRDIWMSRSTDLGATFDTATDVDATDWKLNACPIAGPRMTRAGDSLLTVWMSAASGTSRVYLSTLHAGTMQAGQQLAFPTSNAPTTQTLADVTALGDTVGVVFLEKSKEIVFCYSTQSTANLNIQSTRFALLNHTLQYPSLAFRDGVFHLVYADATADKVLYRRGTVTKSSRTNAPDEGRISVFPNPAVSGESLTVQMKLLQTGKISFDLMDARGKVVRTFSMIEKVSDHPVFTLKTTGLSAGVYFLTARLEGKVLGTEKVILK